MPARPTYHFDVGGHTVVVTQAEEKVDTEPFWLFVITRALAFGIATLLLGFSILFAISWVYYTFFWGA